jgi:hypothetical protein
MGVGHDFRGYRQRYGAGLRGRPGDFDDQRHGGRQHGQHYSHGNERRRERYGIDSHAEPGRGNRRKPGPISSRRQRDVKQLHVHGHVGKLEYLCGDGRCGRSRFLRDPRDIEYHSDEHHPERDEHAYM